jgi:NifU-like protein involved in Fe-S cluster formation
MAADVNATLYTIDILRLAGSLPDPTPLERVDGRSQQRSPTCGSSVLTEVQVDGGRVVAISQSVRACAFGQAAAALVAQHAVGRSREDIAAAMQALTAWLDGTRGDPGGWGLEALAPARSRTSRHGAIVLPLRTLLAAVEEAGA